MPTELYHIVDGQQISGPNIYLAGETYGLVGDCTGVRGKARGVHGDVSNLEGDISNLRGLLSNLLTGDADNVYGYATWVTGSLTNVCGCLSPVFANPHRGDGSPAFWNIKENPLQNECVSGDVSKLRGNLSRNCGEVGDLEDDITNLIGDWSRISGKSKYTLRGFIKPSLEGDISGHDGNISLHDTIPKKKGPS